ncbi:UNVERIFIED_ORG: hypothetical protein M2435_006367 [Rhizobium sophorae]|nr:hypothetical protein [Rhizobium leguminosarum]MDH6663422.1 hypothetical protein [Rhizobium sophorae]
MMLVCPAERGIDWSSKTCHNHVAMPVGVKLFGTTFVLILSWIFGSTGRQLFFQSRATI